MNKKKLIGLVLLVVGIILVVYGYEQVNSIGSKFSKMALGETDIIGYGSMVLGAVLSILGLKSIIRS